MDCEVTRLARPRRGHFDLGTGFHGDVWLDLDALFLRPALLRPHIRWLADRLREHQADAVCGPLEGGAFLAQAIADVLGAAFLPAYRSPGTDPGQATAYRSYRQADLHEVADGGRTDRLAAPGAVADRAVAWEVYR